MNSDGSPLSSSANSERLRDASSKRVAQENVSLSPDKLENGVRITTDWRDTFFWNRR